MLMKMMLFLFGNIKLGKNYQTIWIFLKCMVAYLWIQIKMKSLLLTMKAIKIIPASHTFQKQIQTKYTSAKVGENMLTITI
ncbi:hypothetical protein P8452_32833 [Trifolium repens]|nr:hypothetical protein P8452_32833 [Trifolium repens]